MNVCAMDSKLQRWGRSGFTTRPARGRRTVAARLLQERLGPAAVLLLIGILGAPGQIAAQSPFVDAERRILVSPARLSVWASDSTPAASSR